MASQTEQFTANPTAAPPTPVSTTPPTAPPAPKLPAFRLPVPPPPPWRWWLLAAGSVLNVAIVILAGILLFSDPKEPHKDPAIKVPLIEEKVLWDTWRGWEVQHKGRVKPFDTFARETVRTITGKEKFEQNDPVAVVVSWMMIHRASPGAPAGSSDEIKTAAVARKLDCNWENKPFILCDYTELREMIFKQLGEKYQGPMKDHPELQVHGKFIEPATLRQWGGLEEIMRPVRERMREDDKAPLSMLESKAREVQERLELYDQVREGGGCAVLALDKTGDVWFTPAHIRFFDGSGNASDIWSGWLEKERRKYPEKYKDKNGKTVPMQAYPASAVKHLAGAYTDAQDAYETGDAEKFARATDKLLEAARDDSKEINEAYPGTTMIGLELTFNKAVPFRKAWIYCLIAVLVLTVSVLTGARERPVGRVFYYLGLASFLAGLGYAGYGFFCRVSIVGRPPVSDMYETIIWVSAMTGLFGLVLEMVYRKGFIALAASLVSTIGFVLADQLPNTFKPDLQPLNAVLRSNFWLIIHVLTIVSSYAAFALAWGLGNLNLGLIIYQPHRQDLIKTLSHYSYKAIQIGAILLFAGTMLGGWWANESWGRFWGWDPKEVWALIAFISYIIPLHMRYVGWVKDFGLAACSVCCFAMVVMAWYGVNFVLGAGLHSYGFGSGNNSWVYLAGLINISLVIHAGFRYVSRGGHLQLAE